MSTGNQAKGGVDLFWLAKLFPNPVEVFSLKVPSPEMLVGDCVFVLDTNVLLSPYQVGPESFRNLESLYKGLAAKSRLYAPAQAVREYGKNRGKKVAEVWDKVHQQSSALHPAEALNCPMLEGVSEYQTLKTQSEAIRAKVKEYKATLNALKTVLANWAWNDPVSLLYSEVFSADRIIDHGLAEEVVRADLARRQAHKIPPGYKDSGKPDEGVGDLLIWHTLIKLATDTNHHVVFVCNEEKADWFVRTSQEPLMPRTELNHEFFQRTGRHLAIMNWSRFLATMNADPKTVREAEVAQSTTANLIPIRQHLTAILGELAVMFEEFLDDPDQEDFGTGYRYIRDSRLPRLVGSLEAAAGQFKALESTPYMFDKLDEMVAVCRGIRADNFSVGHAEARMKHSADAETSQIEARCRLYLSLYEGAIDGIKTGF